PATRDAPCARTSPNDRFFCRARASSRRDDRARLLARCARLFAQLERAVRGEEAAVLEPLADELAQPLPRRGGLGALGVLLQVPAVGAREEADLDDVAAGLLDRPL